MAAIKWYITLQIEAGKANPAPPVGPALGRKWLNIQEFCVKFNDATKANMWDIVTVVITAYEDRTFDFIVKSSPASFLIKKALGLKSGSKLPHKDKVGHLTIAQMKDIAEKKMADLNAVDMASAVKIISGAARSMGITTDVDNKTLKQLRAEWL